MTTITSKFTKERLIDWAVVAVAERGRDLKDAPESVEAAANLKLAEIALASLTAEPVAWTDEQELRDVEKDGFGYLFTVKPITPHADPCRIVKLFTVPPAQVVSILDDWQTCEKLSDDSYVDNALRELVEDTTGDNGVRVVQAVIRALRDSGLIRTYPDLSQPVDPQISEYEKIMLQAGNPPVIPDDWISCSERMPAQDDWVLIYSKHGEYLAGQVQGEYVELNDGTLSWLGSALHWMLLPEPPQQEVK